MIKWIRTSRLSIKNSLSLRHVRLLKPLFQDCLMQEKAAEFGKAFNAVPPEPWSRV